MRSIESISHRLDGVAAAMKPERDARHLQAVRQVVTDDGKVRAERLDGWVPPQSVPLDALERGELVEVDPPSIAAGAIGSVAVEIPTAQENDGVVLGPPSDLESGLVPLSGVVTAPGEVTISLMNTTGADIDGVANTWRVVLVR